MTARPAGTTQVLDRYAGLAEDLAWVATAPAVMPGTDDERREVEDVRSWLSAEARWLDSGNYAAWLACCGDDVVFWVPLAVTGQNPGSDQSLLLDDRRRLDERIWRLQDPNAWALHPAPTLTRVIGSAEVWRRGGDLVASSTLTVQMVRTGTVWSTVGRQVHRLYRDPEGTLRLRAKTLLLPMLSVGTPHLGWLL